MELANPCEFTVDIGLCVWSVDCHLFRRALSPHLILVNSGTTNAVYIHFWQRLHLLVSALWKIVAAVCFTTRWFFSCKQACGCDLECSLPCFSNQLLILVAVGARCSQAWKGLGKQSSQRKRDRWGFPISLWNVIKKSKVADFFDMGEEFTHQQPKVLFESLEVDLHFL
jgi:hypothetical protein